MGKNEWQPRYTNMRTLLCRFHAMNKPFHRKFLFKHLPYTLHIHAQKSEHHRKRRNMHTMYVICHPFGKWNEIDSHTHAMQIVSNFGNKYIERSANSLCWFVQKVSRYHVFIFTWKCVQLYREAVFSTYVSTMFLTTYTTLWHNSL